MLQLASNFKQLVFEFKQSRANLYIYFHATMTKPITSCFDFDVHYMYKKGLHVLHVLNCV